MRRLVFAALAVSLMPCGASAEECVGDGDMQSLIESEVAANELGCKGAAGALPKTEPPTEDELKAYCDAGKEAILKPCTDAALATGYWPFKAPIEAQIVAECTTRALDKFGPDEELTASEKKAKNSFFLTCKKFAWSKVRSKLMIPCNILADPWYAECLKDPAAMIKKCEVPPPAPEPSPTETPPPTMTPMPKESPSPTPTEMPSPMETPSATPEEPTPTPDPPTEYPSEPVPMESYDASAYPTYGQYLY